MGDFLVETADLLRRTPDVLRSLLQGLPESWAATPDRDGGWTPKDNLAHLSEWMKALMGYHMDRRPAHEVMDLPEEITRGWDMEVINPELFERNKDRSAEEVLNELRSIYDILMGKLEAMSFEDLMAPRHLDDPRRRPPG